MSIIIIIVIAAIAIFVYRKITGPSEKEILSQREAEEKAKARFAEFKIREMIFHQFNGYIDDLFSKKKMYSESELLQDFSKAFPHYKNGDTRELFRDLYGAWLIEKDHETELYKRGSAFDDLRLTFPGLIEFLKRKGNYINSGFTHNMHGRDSIKKGNISKMLASGNFHFGVSKGREILNELKIVDNNISEQSLYLYTKTERHTQSASNPNEKKLLHHDYKLLEKEISFTQYEQILNDWLAKATEIMESVRGKLF